MAQSSFPFENVDTSETQFSQMFRNFAAGVNGTPSGTELKVTSGTGLQVNVAAGQAMVRGHYYISTASEALTIAAANPTNPRIDSIVLTLDPTANSIVLAVVTGTPASSPVAPTLTQTDAGIFQYQLATVAVAAGAGSVGTITDTRNFFGSRFGIWATAGRPSAPYAGQAGYNSTLGYPEYYNGTSWASFIGATNLTDPMAHGYTPTWTTGNYRRNVPLAGMANGTLSAQSGYTVYSPIYIPSSVTIDRLSFYVTTSAGSNAAVGIYADNNGVPSTRLYSPGSIATATTGLKELTVNITLTAGVYWVGLYVMNNTLQMPVIDTVAFMEINSLAPSNPVTKYVENVSIPATASPSFASSAGMFAVWLRKA